MNITFKLYATLTDYLPAEARTSNRVAMDVPEGATVAEVVAQYNLPPKLVHLVLINGTYVAPEDRPTRALQAEDVLAIWPPIAGG